MLYAAAAVLLSRVILKTAGSLMELFVGQKDLLLQIAQIVGQLKTAAITSPWFPTILAGTAVGALLGGLLPNPKIRLRVGIIAGLLLLIPCIATVLCFTKVNSIEVRDLLRVLLPLLSGL